MKVCSWAMYAQIERKFPKTDSVKNKEFRGEAYSPISQIYCYHYCSSPSPWASHIRTSVFFHLRINFWQNSSFKNLVGLPGRRNGPSQGLCLHTTATIQIYIVICIPTAFSVESVQIGYKEVFGSTEQQSSRKWKVELRDASLPGYELGSRRI
jgi:hypothetical protein